MFDEPPCLVRLLQSDFGHDDREGAGEGDDDDYDDEYDDGRSRSLAEESYIESEAATVRRAVSYTYVYTCILKILGSFVLSALPQFTQLYE